MSLRKKVEGIHGSDLEFFLFKFFDYKKILV